MPVSFFVSLLCAACGMGAVEPVELIRCPTCLHARYCSDACRVQHVEQHKSACRPPPSMISVLDAVNAASRDHEWRVVLRFQWIMPDLLLAVMRHLAHSIKDQIHTDILVAFINAHLAAFREVGGDLHLLWYIRLVEKYIVICGDSNLFRTQGHVICRAGNVLYSASNFEDAKKFYIRARKIAQAHGFLGVESRVLCGFGMLKLQAGEFDRALMQLQSALDGIYLSESPKIIYIIEILDSIIYACFYTGMAQGLHQLMRRYRAQINITIRQWPRIYFPYYLRCLVFDTLIYQVFLFHIGFP